MQVTQVIFTALAIQTVVGETRSTIYQRLPETDVIFSKDLLFEDSAFTKGHCCLLCLNYTGCVSFAYTENSTSSGTCRGHSSLQICSHPQTARADTQYYGIPVRPNKAENCQDMRTLQPGSGVRQLDVNGTLTVSAYCDQDTDCGGWTVIQKRQDGSVNFNLTWPQYQAGFGDPAGEYWLGLETIYKMTSTRSYELRFDLQMYNGTTGFAVYSNFSVGPSSDFYRLRFASRTAGNLSEMFYYNNGSTFSTWERDNDGISTNCAMHYGGGWWYLGCSLAYLHTPYSQSASCPISSDCYICMHWRDFGPLCSNALQKMAMKIRPLSP